MGSPAGVSYNSERRLRAPALTPRPRLARITSAGVLAVLLFLLQAGAARSLHAQDAPGDPPKFEFRGAWIATVLGLDWPTAGTTEGQKQELVEMLAELKAAGINAVFFQVRSESDAMYASSIEPWSYWLTGEQGQAPDPFYDPLAFAVEEAHKRGMELHAWFNPYRADRGSGYATDDGHVTAQHPEWILDLGPIEILNPGIPAVREYVTEVIVDVVERYDVDGVHFDDYFYPYPPNQITDEDQATFETYNEAGLAEIEDWRRYNVDELIRHVHEGIEATRPEVVFGVSPFGIWQDGVPPGIFGLDAYNLLFADPVNWLEEQWIDYLTPQLYWPFGGGQDYGTLAPWWADHAATNGRHLYAGHGLYKADNATRGAAALYAPDEVPRQVRLNRESEAIQGSVFFRASNITDLHTQGFADSLRTDLFRYPALTPALEWNDTTVPPAPSVLTFQWTEEEEVTLSWLAPDEDVEEPAFYAVYRVRSEDLPDLSEATSDARNLLAVTGDTSITDRPGIAPEPYHYAVASVSSNSIESALTNVVSLEGQATAVEMPEEAIAGIELRQNHPNPFRSVTNIRFRLDAADEVTLTVYNALGQRVASLLEARALTPGAYDVAWDASGRIAAGTYFYVLEAGGRRVSRSMVLVR